MVRTFISFFSVGKVKKFQLEENFDDWLDDFIYLFLANVVSVVITKVSIAVFKGRRGGRSKRPNERWGKKVSISSTLFVRKIRTNGIFSTYR